MPRPVYLSKLEKISILWPGDVYAFAQFILRSYDAIDREMSAESGRARGCTRPTLQGLASSFASVTRTPVSRARDEFLNRGLALSAIVAFDPESDAPEP